MPKMQHELSDSQVINAVLDAILAVSQIDPASFLPDDALRVGLGLSQAQIHEVLLLAASRLQIKTLVNTARFEEATPRQLVNYLSDLVRKAQSTAA